MFVLRQSLLSLLFLANNNESNNTTTFLSNTIFFSPETPFNFPFHFLVVVACGWIKFSIAEEVIPAFKPPALITKSPVGFFKKK